MSNPIVSFDEEAVKSELRELVRKTIEETINAMLDERPTGWWALRPTSAPTRGRRIAPATTSAASPRRRARSRSGCPSQKERNLSWVLWGSCPPPLGSGLLQLSPNCRPPRRSTRRASRRRPCRPCPTSRTPRPAPSAPDRNGSRACRISSRATHRADSAIGTAFSAWDIPACASRASPTRRTPRPFRLPCAFARRCSLALANS